VARKQNPDGKMSLSGHLKELRNRAFWSAIFLLLGSIAGWYLFDQVFEELQRPIVEIAEQSGTNATINFPTVVSAFDVRLQVSIFLGLLISSPVWLFNIWAFITPGLKQKERKYTIWFVICTYDTHFFGDFFFTTIGYETCFLKIDDCHFEFCFIGRNISLY
jgi:sec-independent protein translocase protein TatC